MRVFISNKTKYFPLRQSGEFNKTTDGHKDGKILTRTRSIDRRRVFIKTGEERRQETRKLIGRKIIAPRGRIYVNVNVTLDVLKIYQINSNFQFQGEGKLLVNSLLTPGYNQD